MICDASDVQQLIIKHRGIATEALSVYYTDHTIRSCEFEWQTYVGNTRLAILFRTVLDFFDRADPLGTKILGRAVNALGTEFGIVLTLDDAT